MKKKSGIAALVPVAIACLFMGFGFFWLVVGLIISICTQFQPGFIEPIFWIVGGIAFVIGLTAFIILKLLAKKDNK